MGRACGSGINFVLEGLYLFTGGAFRIILLNIKEMHAISIRLCLQFAGENKVFRFFEGARSRVQRHSIGRVGRALLYIPYCIEGRYMGSITLDQGSDAPEPGMVVRYALTDGESHALWLQAGVHHLHLQQS